MAGKARSRLAQPKRAKREQPPADFQQYSKLFRLLGSRGGTARAKNLNAKERREGARKAARARWKKASKA
jgi:hypothetical protein